MPVQIVAELGINHNGSVEIAKKMIDVAYSAGCDYVKLQKRTVDAVYTKEELDKPRESPWGTTTRDQKKGLEFGFNQLEEIDAYCKGKIPWFASPWDTKSVFDLTRFDIPFIKIPSALITNWPLIRLILEKHDKPLIISTGMSTSKMIDEAVNLIGDRLYCLMHCTSTYPTVTEELNLNYILALREKYEPLIVGFSNHHPGIPFMVAAVALGAEMIECHLSLDRSSYGSDQAASIESGGLRRVVRYIRAIEKAMGDGVKRIYESEKPIIEKLRR